MISASSLALQNVGYRIGSHQILSDLSLAATQGRFLAIVGPNGCGKSTSLRMMAGLIKPAAGQVVLDGQPLAQFTRKALSRQVALLTQSGQVPGNLSVRELVGMGRFAHQTVLSRASAQDDAAIEAALVAMDVQDLADRPAAALSGGQLQRCRMAMTLAQDTGVLLLDEPTTYLDLRFQYGILDKARALARAGRTVVAVLHDFTQASLYADEVAVLSQGRLVAQGAPAAVLDERLVAEVFGVRTQAVHAHGAVFHVPRSAMRLD
ncbi:iron complex transport system ATP-binding protein [Ketogulonicigenium robustum]|uniref:Iron complex transport system ATP-binding protein n=1 Tax=Ketogulonicigenium robustum TaxID=92947 RepID=A0A1W6P023_9RHOB|nr:ABC transporter ATP-binding protein [Ketogulonicigenium robustum]ARO14617.1 iron complex transport system ATP-binding protein [Ketogulonicigenium robustum]